MKETKELEKVKKFFNNMIKNVSKKDLILILVFSLTVVFNMFIFSGFDILISNQLEFGVSVNEVIWLFVWRSLLIFLGLFLVLFIICNYYKPAFHVMLALLLGLTFAQYLQILLFNGNYVNLLDGSSAHSASDFMVWFNLVIFVVIIFVPIIFIIIKKNELFKKITLILCSLIFVMQFVGLIGVSSVAPTMSVSENNNISYCSFYEYSNLSKNGENIVVFLVDSLDTRTTQGVFNKWPESKEIFNGFTFFTNNISQYRATIPSLVSILTNYEFTETQTASEFYSKAWENNILYDALHERNYVVNGLFNGTATYQNIEDITPYFDNVKQSFIENRILNDNKIFNSLLQLSFLRSSPFILKNNFTISNFSDLGNEFVEIENIEDDFYSGFMSGNRDLKYNSLITEAGILNSQEKNVFNFVHLNGPHLPYVYDENLAMIDHSLSGADKACAQSYGVFKILNNYFSQMKELGIFENSTIIVLADHSYGVYNDYERSTATLLVKPKGAENVEIVTNETAQTSNRNFVPTILKIIGADDLTTEKSYFELADPGITQTRYFYKTNWQGGIYSPIEYEGKFTINGDAWNLDNWSLLEE